MSELFDGFASKISFTDWPVEFKEKSVTAPGLEGGGEVDTTTMRNTDFRTKNPKALKGVSDAKCTVAYDPVVYDTIVDLVGVNSLISIQFSDGHFVRFWGWLDSFVPGEMAEGVQPTAEITLIVSNLNASDVETAPVYAAT